MVMFDGIPAKGHTLEELEAAIRDEIKRVQTELVSEDELERIRAQIIAEQVYELDSVYYQALQIGLLETIGLGWQMMDEYVKQLNAVTPEQVMAVAKKYLQEDYLTVTILEPQPMEEKIAKGAAAGDHDDA